MAVSRKPVRVFVSYAHEDRPWCDKLMMHLGALQKSGRIKPFDDSQLQPGEWERQLSAELDRADVVVLILTPSFGNSRFCASVELTRALQRFASERACVIPVLAEHFDWQALPLEHFQILPQDDHRNVKPLREWPDPNVPLTQLARTIREIVEQIEARAETGQQLPSHRVAQEESGDSVAFLSHAQPDQQSPAVSGVGEYKRGVPTNHELRQAQFTSIQDKAPLMAGRAVHPWEIKYELSIGYVPGTDDARQEWLARQVRRDPSVTVFPLSPTAPQDYLQNLDDQVRRSRCVALLISAESRQRVEPAIATVAAAVRTVLNRDAARLALLTIDLPPTGVPKALRDVVGDIYQTMGSQWEEAQARDTFEQVRLWCRKLTDEPPPNRAHIGIPFLILALTQLEAEQLRDSQDSFFKDFGGVAKNRRADFKQVIRSLQRSQLKWPDVFYGERREQWSPFGDGTQNIQTIVKNAARTVSTTPPGSRERRVLSDSMLVPQRYAFDEYLNDVAGSRSNLRRVCENGCLVIVDEFALLHPRLRSAINELLASNNAAVVSLSACDPAHSPLKKLMGDSYLRVGTLLPRFQQREDVSCELALNNKERLQRWLRLVLPELMTTLAQQQSNPELVQRADDLLAV